MAKYYGIERSAEYLEHYGIKGMKWGVRKALAKGNTRALMRHYRKASRKLAKLEAKANISQQKNKIAKAEKYAKYYRSIGRAGLGTAIAGIGGKALANTVINADKMSRAIEYPERLAISPASELAQRAKHNAEFSKRFSNAQKIGDAIRNAGAGMAVAGYIGYGINKYKANKAKKLITKSGNSKAVIDARNWKRAMDETFKGARKQKRHKRKSARA